MGTGRVPLGPLASHRARRSLRDAGAGSRGLSHSRVTATRGHETLTVCSALGCCREARLVAALGTGGDSRRLNDAILSPSPACAKAGERSGEFRVEQVLQTETGKVLPCVSARADHGGFRGADGPTHAASVGQRVEHDAGLRVRGARERWWIYQGCIRSPRRWRRADRPSPRVPG